MDFFNIPEGANLLPPEEVRIRSLRIEPWPDGRRIKVFIELTPFQQKPSLDLTITDESGDEFANVSIIETMMTRLVLTMHLPEGAQPGEYRLAASLFYEDQGQIHSSEVNFQLQEGQPDQ